jgi:hypothetical protein
MSRDGVIWQAWYILRSDDVKMTFRILSTYATGLGSRLVYLFVVYLMMLVGQAV